MDNWACPKCGFTNEDSATHCVSCDGPRVTEDAMPPKSGGPVTSPSAAKQLEAFQAEAKALRASATKPATTPMAKPATAEAARPGGCQVCGRRPAGPFNFRANVGMVFARRTYSFDGWLCRTCATGKFREYQGRNLAWGWFGVISFIQTLDNAFHNLRDYRSNRQNLGEPTPPDPAQDKKRVGRPIILRVLPGLGVIAAIVALIAVFTTSGWSVDRTADATYRLAEDSVDSSYITAFVQINAAGNALSDLAESRWKDWADKNESGYPTSVYLVVDEVKAFQALMKDMPPPVSAELRALHQAWVAAVEDVVAAEQALAAEGSSATVAADIQAWTAEYTAYKAVFDYAKAQDA